MALLHKNLIIIILFILPLLFLAAVVDADHHDKHDKHRRRHHHDDDDDNNNDYDNDDNDNGDVPNPLPDHPDNPIDLLKQPKDPSLPDDNNIGDDPTPKVPFGGGIIDNPVGSDNSLISNPINKPRETPSEGKDLNQDAPAKPDFSTASLGTWELSNVDVGVSAMHTQLMPINRIFLYDTIIYRISRIKARPGECIPFLDPQNVTQLDCWAHVVEYDVESNQVVRPIKVCFPTNLDARHISKLSSSDRD